MNYYKNITKIKKSMKVINYYAQLYNFIIDFNFIKIIKKYLS